MEMIVLLTKTYSALETTESIRKFLRNELAAIIEAIGDIQHQASLAAIRDARLSSNPEREVNSGITLLRSSLTSYLAAAEEKKFFGLIKLSAEKKAALYQKAAEAAIICAAAYAALGESALARDYSDRALEAFDKYTDCAAKAITDSVPQVRYSSLVGAILTEVMNTAAEAEAKRKRELLLKERDELAKVTERINAIARGLT